MRPGARRSHHSLALSGLWIAAIGFFVTRFTVTLAAFETRTQFLVAGIVPLALGLVLATFGVALLVGSFDRSFVRSVAIWCTAGTFAMASLVALTLAGTGGATGLDSSIRSDVVLSNFLIGGGLLGALTGLYAGQNGRNRAELRQQANRLETINRLLRHEVLNAIAIIRGRAETFAGAGEPPQADDSIRQILAESDRIVETVEDVKHLTASSGDRLAPVDLVDAVDRCVDVVRADYPDADVSVSRGTDGPVRVWADDQLATALSPLVENAAAYGDDSVEVELAVGARVACVRVVDSGPGLPAEHRATLEDGSIPDFDDPSVGFGTNVARLFVEGYGGDIRTEVTEGGTVVEVELALASIGPPTPTATRAVRSVGLDRPDLLATTAAALVAGVAMGVFVQAAAGVIPVIGALYGVADPLVGWLTHEFHSVVFGLVYAGALAMLPPRYGERLVPRLGVAVAWTLLLWLVAAGVVMPVWLNLVGIPAPVPNVSLPSLGGHLVWGVVLGGSYHALTAWRGT